MAHSQISELIIYLDLTSSGVTAEQDMVELRAVTPDLKNIWLLKTMR